MSLIRLSHALEDSELLQEYDDYEPEELADFIADISGLALTHDVQEYPPVNLPRAISDDGVEYENVQFIVNTRYTQNGDVYLAGLMFSFNYSEYLRDLRAALESADK
jgi:hypothetical protein